MIVSSAAAAFFDSWTAHVKYTSSDRSVRSDPPLPVGPAHLPLAGFPKYTRCTCARCRRRRGSRQPADRLLNDANYETSALPRRRGVCPVSNSCLNIAIAIGIIYSELRLLPTNTVLIERSIEPRNHRSKIYSNNSKLIIPIIVYSLKIYKLFSSS